MWVTGGKLALTEMSVSEERKTILGTKQTLCVARRQAQNWTSSVHLLVRGEQDQQLRNCSEPETFRANDGAWPIGSLANLASWPD